MPISFTLDAAGFYYQPPGRAPNIAAQFLSNYTAARTPFAKARFAQELKNSDPAARDDLLRAYSTNRTRLVEALLKLERSQISAATSEAEHEVRLDESFGTVVGALTSADSARVAASATLGAAQTSAEASLLREEETTRRQQLASQAATPEALKFADDLVAIIRRKDEELDRIMAGPDTAGKEAAVDAHRNQLTTAIGEEFRKAEGKFDKEQMVGLGNAVRQKIGDVQGETVRGTALQEIGALLPALEGTTPPPRTITQRGVSARSPREILLEAAEITGRLPESMSTKTRTKTKTDVPPSPGSASAELPARQESGPGGGRGLALRELAALEAAERAVKSDPIPGRTTTTTSIEGLIPAGPDDDDEEEDEDDEDEE